MKMMTIVPEKVVDYKKQGVEGLREAVQRIGEIRRASCREHVDLSFTVAKMADDYERGVHETASGVSISLRYKNTPMIMTGFHLSAGPAPSGLP
jgi:hypothetical protein